MPKKGRKYALKILQSAAGSAWPGMEATIKGNAAFLKKGRWKNPPAIGIYYNTMPWTVNPVIMKVHCFGLKQ